MQITDSIKYWTNGWSDWLSYKSRVFLSDNYQHSCPKFANILSGISILEIMDLVPFISITRNKLHANNVQLFTSPAYDYLWPPTSYLNLLSRLVYFLAAFKEMKTLNCPTNTPFTLYWFVFFHHDYLLWCNQGWKTWFLKSLWFRGCFWS